MWKLVGSLTCGLLMAAGAATAEPILDEEDTVRCVSLFRIKQVEVLDKQNILFRMRGKKNYLNRLPHPCPGLRKNQPFMYRTSLNQLCDLDIITVLDSGAFGLRPMASCGLGTFERVSEEQLREVKGKGNLE